MPYTTGAGRFHVNAGSCGCPAWFKGTMETWSNRKSVMELDVKNRCESRIGEASEKTNSPRSSVHAVFETTAEATTGCRSAPFWRLILSPRLKVAGALPGGSLSHAEKPYRWFRTRGTPTHGPCHVWLRPVTNNDEAPSFLSTCVWEISPPIACQVYVPYSNPRFRTRSWLFSGGHAAASLLKSQCTPAWSQYTTVLPGFRRLTVAVVEFAPVWNGNSFRNHVAELFPVRLSVFSGKPPATTDSRAVPVPLIRVHTLST